MACLEDRFPGYTFMIKVPYINPTILGLMGPGFRNQVPTLNLTYFAIFGTPRFLGLQEETLYSEPQKVGTWL